MRFVGVAAGSAANLGWKSFRTDRPARGVAPELVFCLRHRGIYVGRRAVPQMRKGGSECT